jgi:hypothetical protein
LGIFRACEVFWGENLALGRGIQEIGEGMNEVELSGLGRLKERDPLRVDEEIDTIRRHRPMTPSFPLNKVKDELRDFRSPDDDKAVRVFGSFFSHGESDLDDEACDPFEEDRDEGELAENGSLFQSSDSRFVKDLQILFSSAIQPFGSRAKRAEFLVARGTTDDLGDQPGMLLDGHMLNESVVIDKEGTGIGVFL